MDSDWAVDTTDAYLAATTARYDLAVSRQLFDGFASGALVRRVGMENWDSSATREELFEAAVAVDPAHAVAMVESLPQPEGLSSNELRNAARLAVAKILVKTGRDRSRELERRLLPLPPGEWEEN